MISSPRVPPRLVFACTTQTYRGCGARSRHMFWGGFRCFSGFPGEVVLSTGGGVSRNFYSFLYFHATLCSSGAAGEGTQPVWCQPVALKLATIQRFRFGGARPAVCLHPCFTLIRGDNLPGPARLIWELLMLREISKWSLLPWIAGVFIA